MCRHRFSAESAPDPDQGLIRLKSDVDTLKASVQDIAENPKKLTFKQLESANLPRAVDDLDIAAFNVSTSLFSRISP